MNYEDYKANLLDAINQMFKYDSDKHVGSLYYAEKAGKLEDDYPEYYAQFELEMDW